MEEAVIKRIMPHSEEAEQSVVGSMLMDKDAILVASEIITGEDFYAKQYGIVFDACVELYNEGKPVDLITLQDRLREKDVPPEVSRLEFVRELLTSVPTSANVKYYAEIVREKSMLRRLIKVTDEISNTCLTWCPRAILASLCPSVRWSSTRWTVSRRPPRRKETSPAWPRASLIWTTGQQGCSPLT